MQQYIWCIKIKYVPLHLKVAKYVYKYIKQHYFV